MPAAGTALSVSEARGPNTAAHGNHSKELKIQAPKNAAVKCILSRGPRVLPWRRMTPGNGERFRVGSGPTSAGRWRVAPSCARCVSAGLRAAAPLAPPGRRGRGALPGARLHQPLAQVRRLREPGQLSSVGFSFVPELSFLPSVLSTSYVTGVRSCCLKLQYFS